VTSSMTTEVRIALDTNVLAYAEGVDDPVRQARAWHVLERLAAAELFVPAQVLGELFNVLVKKAGRSRAEARDAVLVWSRSYAVIDIRGNVTAAALDLSASHDLGIWDAVIVSAAALAGCSILLSEDMQAGFTWSGLTVVNPFAEPIHPALAAHLGK